MKISVIMVVMDRPSLQESLDSVKDADEFIIMRDDFSPRKEQVTLMNEAAEKAKGDVLFYMGERQVFAPDWRQKACDALEKLNYSGLVSFYETTAMAGCVTRDFYENELMGNLWAPDYVHYCVDVEISDVARKHGKYIEVLDVLIKQHEKGEKNSYSTSELAEFDRRTYEMRTILGWPNKRVRTDEERQRYL